jgi:hypothetical protein
MLDFTKTKTIFFPTEVEQDMSTLSNVPSNYSEPICLPEINDNKFALGK